MPSESSEQHRKWAAERGPVRVAIITVSDSRTPETDTNRQFLEVAIREAGHQAAAYRLIRDEPVQVEAVLEELTGTDAQILLWNGGTGISERDTTYDVLSRKLQKTLPGFGEIFRMLSYGQVGRGGDVVASRGRNVSRKSCDFDSGITGRGATGVGEADRAGDGALSLGNRPIGRGRFSMRG